MHMSDALISAPVGGVMFAVSGVALAYSAKKLRNELGERRVPMMGVLGAFVFSAQMINFSIPGTGSSGHLGGATLLAILLGPHAAFVVIASVVAVQAFFFADGGILALGCNVFNIGFFPCLIAYPIIYRSVVGARSTPRRILAGSMLSAVFGLQMGAFSVVAETALSGIAELPFHAFVAFMLPIHLAIGIVEGLITSAVVNVVWKARPELLESSNSRFGQGFSAWKVFSGFAAATVLTAGVLSWFASFHPDGLEWAVNRTSHDAGISAQESGMHSAAKRLQDATALLPDYGFRKAEGDDAKGGAAHAPAFVDTGTSAAGLIGALLTTALIAFVGFALRTRANWKSKA